MNTGISRRSLRILTALGLCGALAGCNAAQGFSFAAAGKDDAAQGTQIGAAIPKLASAELARGAVNVTAPKGYCIDQTSIVSGLGGSSATLAPCSALDGKGASREMSAVMTVSVSPRRPSPAPAPTSADLAGLALPAIGSQAIRKAHDADWAWRPEAWTGPLPKQGIASVPSKSMLGKQLTLHHDCALSELSLRQLRNTREADLAPYGLRLDVFRFDGSFLSLVLDFPEDGVRGLRRKHLIRLEPLVEFEKPLEIFARLNIKHGPNTEQIVRELPLGEEVPVVEFDLAYTKLNEKRVDAIWLDLIFEGPQMNQITMRDVTISRRPRSEI